MSHEWLLNLKEDDTVVVNSTTFEPIEKQFERYAQTKAGRGFESEKTIILKNCGTRFHLNGRGKGSLSHRNKWLTEPKQKRMDALNELTEVSQELGMYD